MSDTSTLAIAAIESMRTDLTAAINKACDGLLTAFTPATASAPAAAPVFKMPTPQDGLHPSNKNGLNLTPRGVEILYRVFDDGGGYNRAAKMVSISQGAAKNRKASWLAAGGLNRKKELLDIDTAGNPA